MDSARAMMTGLSAAGKRNLFGHETPDGDFGPKTENAVRDFRTEKVLEPDGEIGPDTWAVLVTRGI